MQISIGYPTREGETDIIQRFLNSNPLEALTPVSNTDDWVAIQKTTQTVKVHPDLCGYIADLTAFTRRHEAVALGVSPRGALALAKSAQGYAVLQGRDYVRPEDIKYLAPFVWPHRLLLRGRNVSKVQVVADALASVPVPTEDMFS